MDVRGYVLGPPHGTTTRTLIYKGKSGQCSVNATPDFSEKKKYGLMIVYKYTPACVNVLIDYA